MTLVKASIEIDAPPEAVYEKVLDPDCLSEWVTIHRRVNQADSGEPRKGYEMNQTLHLRGANFKVQWTLTEAERGRRATWEGRGPAHSYARTAYRLSPVDGGSRTRFDYENEFKAPGGAIGAAASRVLVGGVPQREANRSLQNLKSLIERARR
jgi:uncharacterized protein YndB with AHSA1/START domain